MDESFVIVEGNSPSLLLLPVAHGSHPPFRSVISQQPFDDSTRLLAQAALRAGAYR